VQPLLGDLCAGVDGNELPSALGGLLAASAHVRAAALAALPSVPALAAGECPQDSGVTAVLCLARFDAHPGASLAARISEWAPDYRASCDLSKAAASVPS